MPYEIKTLSVEECKRWIDTVSGKKFDSPEGCLKELDVLDKSFRESMLERIRFEEIPQSLKDRIRDFLDYCAPAICYRIEEITEISPDSTVTLNKCEIILKQILYYKLNIITSPEDIAAQTDALYTTAAAALSDPLLNKGYNPRYVLTSLGESCWKETDVRDPEEIERIASRLVKRFFAEIPEYADNASHNDPVKDTEPVDMSEPNIEELNTSIKTMRENVRQLFSEKCEDIMCHSNPAKISALAQWIKLPKLEIEAKVKKDIEIKQEGNRNIIEFPERHYRITTPEESFSRILDTVLSFISEALTESVLSTSATSLRKDLENIIKFQDDDSKDMRALLKQVICNNFNVDIIEIDNEDDDYATPQYFNVSRANVDKLITTKPAILSKTNGLPILKGHYVVPLAPADTK